MYQITYNHKKIIKRLMEVKLNTLIDDALKSRIAIIEDDDDLYRCRQDMIELVFSTNGIETAPKVNTTWKDPSLEFVNVSSERRTLQMDANKKMLEAKLRLSAEKGKNTAAYKQLKALSKEPFEGSSEDLISKLAKLNPSLSEEVLIERGD